MNAASEHAVWASSLNVVSFVPIRVLHKDEKISGENIPIYRMRKLLFTILR
jgi:hypothetical protein